MSYYILPSIAAAIADPTTSPRCASSVRSSFDCVELRCSQPIISHSLDLYYRRMNDQLVAASGAQSFADIIRCNNPFELMAQIGRDSGAVFYDMFEVNCTLNLLGNGGSNDAEPIRTLHIGGAPTDNKYLTQIRNNPRDDHRHIAAVTAAAIVDLEHPVAYIFLDCCSDMSAVNVNVVSPLNREESPQLNVVDILSTTQAIGGTFVARMGATYDAASVQFLYALTMLYDRVIVMKPSTSNAITFDKYIVCTGYIGQQLLLPSPLPIPPLYFLNKINDINIILGQRQLEFLDQLIFIMKNKYRDEKLEIARKTNIQKCIAWCKKYQLPFHVDSSVAAAAVAGSWSR